jgi:formamidopyrimidine-DNA glycosylase
MPELPEVETTRRGIDPHAVDRCIERVLIRNAKLRWPIEKALAPLALGQRILGTRRRAKYLLIDLEHHTLMIHLGMSGSLRVMPASTPPMFHDHVDIVLNDGNCLRYNDPRRFGSFHLLTSDDHPLLRHLGPEPLSNDFDGAWLYRAARGRKAAVKQFLMDGRIVVGVGNIYANEALFMAGIRPTRRAGNISLQRYQRLAEAVKELLASAIEQGGTTLRDFVGGDGKPGYFAQKLRVYGRGGLSCRACSGQLQEIRLGNRTTVFCAHCQR